MKDSGDLLKRLFKAAAGAPQPDPEDPPFALEARSVTVLRGSRAVSEWDGVLRFLRIGLGFSAVLMLVIIALSFRSIPKEPADELAMPAAVLNLALLE